MSEFAELCGEYRNLKKYVYKYVNRHYYKYKYKLLNNSKIRIRLYIDDCNDPLFYEVRNTKYTQHICNIIGMYGFVGSHNEIMNYWKIHLKEEKLKKCIQPRQEMEKILWTKILPTITCPESSSFDVKLCNKNDIYGENAIKDWDSEIYDTDGSLMTPDDWDYFRKRHPKYDLIIQQICPVCLKEITSKQLKARYYQIKKQTSRERKEIRLTYIHSMCIKESGYLSD